MEFFVDQNSIVKRIWGKSDTIIFIFAGAAAEFALNKAVDWLFFTGRLPADPLGRLFSTVAYARQIVFSPKEGALKAIDTMAKIHAGVEEKRGYSIPDWAYRDVLFMLIDYSIRSYELLERTLSEEEKTEVFDVFYRVGERMGLKGLPQTYSEWLLSRQEHLENNMENSHYTVNLFAQYKKHLGFVRYKLLLEAQSLVVPARVSQLLEMRKFSLLRPVIPVYKLSARLNADWYLKALLLPEKYKAQVKALDSYSSA